MTGLAWRQMEEGDLEGVVAVARIAFPDHFERRACFEERLALFPQGCFVLAVAEAVQGYLIAYPWPLGSVPPLDSLLGSLPDDGGAWYLHDLAFHPDARGQGHARPIVADLFGAVREMGCRTIALVAVNASAPFWRGMGFAPVTGDPALARKLANYGDEAAYMIRAL
jgi:ribosomal protein S18 acetylase RimI-like enzyme